MAPPHPKSSRPFSSSSARRDTMKELTSDPFLYTTGRWLNQDELQRQSRSLKFNFSLLCETVAKIYPGASKVDSYEKKEGGYNRVFIFTLDNGKKVVAKVPTSVAGPPRLTTNSEVATMAYLRSKSSLPIPETLLWNDDPSNPVGIEYIVQEHADGVNLHEHWPEMDIVQHMQCTKELSLQIREMASLDFPAYGSLYFADAPIEEKLKIPFGNGFCIGPYCSPLFWNCGAGESDIYKRLNTNRGPWRDLKEYSAGLIDTALSRLPKEQPADDRLPFRGTIQEHSDLIDACRKSMNILIEDERVQTAATPALIHPDYNKRNIYVSPDDPTKVTGLIDWQLASIEPAFIYVHGTPDFASLADQDPAEVDEPEKAQSEDERRLQKDLSICHQTYDVIMKGKIPKMRAATRLDPTFFRLFHYCFTTWRDGAPAIRQELLDLRSLWSELGLPGSCPFDPDEEELHRHAKQYEDFETRQKLKTWLTMQLNSGSDGWVPNEIWDAAQEANRAAYAEWMESAKELGEAEGMTPDKADRLWPFDAR
ncbi:altered inheritance of mitochondria protein 9 [Trichophyton mentagrophytes]|nr:altered inheritance of mitochondria protein 9 [Trichophyton mentagrophytes]